METPEQEHILVCVAWPYTVGPRHLGHIAGAGIQPDIFVRYQRMMGRAAIMVSGSDTHGTPTMVKADAAGVPPAKLVNRVHTLFCENYQQMGFSYDLYTDTETANHYQTTQTMFLHLKANGYIYKDTAEAAYCETDRRFLPDRYVEGTCPICGYKEARGDQCDNCGNLLDPIQLIDIRCKLCGNPPIFRPSDHYYLDLAKLQPMLEDWVKSGGHEQYWRTNVYNFTIGSLRDGMHGRAITRDLDWGVPVPVDDPDFKDKRIYVWFDAVIGYLSATIEWAALQGTPERWKDWWLTDTPTKKRIVNFIGKDNITFHTIIWPAILLGYSGLELPYDVPATQYLTDSGQKMSASKGGVPLVPDVLERYDPDMIRYYLCAAAPDNRDSDWSWAEFFRRNNDELVATYGNLVNRVLNPAYRNFEGKVPEPLQEHIGEPDQQMLAETRAAFDTVGDLIDRVKLKEALREVMALATKVNVYLDQQEPWKTVKVDKAQAATTYYVALQALAALRILTAPFLPFSAQRLHAMLGYAGEVSAERWQMRDLPPDQPLGEPAPLFKKYDEKTLPDLIVEEEQRSAREWIDPDGPIQTQPTRPRVVIYNQQLRLRAELGVEQTVPLA